MAVKVTEDEIFQIGTEKRFGEFLVKRVNASNLDVYHSDVIVFQGEDYEIAEYINQQ